VDDDSRRAGHLGAVVPILTGAVISALLVLTPAGAPSADAKIQNSLALSRAAWPMALHDARHSGLAPVNGPTSGHVEWTRDLMSNITPGPVIGADGTIYVATNAGVLHALNPSTGADEWTFSGGGAFAGTTSDLSVSPLVLPSGSILFPGPGGVLYEISPTGTQEWSHPFGASLTSPVLFGSTVVIATTAGRLVALDVAHAVPSIRWTLSIGRHSYGSPVIAPDGRIITTVDDCVVAVADRGNTGQVVWTHTFSGSVEVSASVGSDGTIVVGTNDPYEYGFTPNGEVKWRVSRDHSFSYSSPSVTPDGFAYFGDNNGVLRVVRSDDGRVVVTDAGTKGLWGAQAIDSRHDVYFGTQGGHIYGFNATGGTLFNLPATGPIDSYPALTANGTLIIGDQAGTLYAIG